MWSRPLAVLHSLLAVVGSTTAVRGRDAGSEACAPSACSVCAFQDIIPDNAAVLSAVRVQSGSSYGEGPANVAYPDIPTDLPELCAITVSVSTSPTSFFRFGVFLPTEWNGRMLTVGNGGFAGGINWLDIGYGVRYGLATVSTDTGHNSTAWKVDWAYKNEERRKDWGYRAIHGSVELGKTLIRAYYKKNITYSYYAGASTGGRQGLKEMQVDATSFDGALVGAPAWWVTHGNAIGSHVGATNLPSGAPHHIPSSFTKAFGDEVVRQCDEVDGVKDGIISAPDQCTLDLGLLACKSKDGMCANSTNCLRPVQTETIKTIYQNYTINGEFMAPGPSISSEHQWSFTYLTNDDKKLDEYVNYFVLDDPLWNWEQYNDSMVLQAIRTDPGNVVPDDYEAMVEYANRGGKLLMYHGLSDGLVQPAYSTLYREFVLNATAGKVKEDWFRLFMVPGMQHTQGTAVGAPWYIGASGQTGYLGNGPGPRELDDGEHNGLLALMAWVETGKPVDKLVATSWVDEKVPSSGVLRQRPWCPYPSTQRFTGGNEKKAENWECM